MAADTHTPASEQTGQQPELRKVLGPVQLTALGIGGIIGTGIFVITGKAAALYAGPAIVISFVIAGIGCVFAALCYAEFAAMIPMSGSAYTYSYAAFGRFWGWVIGWDLALEYGVAASTVAVGWTGYFKDLLKDAFGVALPDAFSSAPLGKGPEGDLVLTGAVLNVPAAAIVLLLTALLVVGIRASATTNGLIVLLKVGIVLAVIIFGLPLIHAANLDPFIPENTGKFGEFGWSGILRGAGAIFFAYIGFDSVSVAAQESRNPQRDLPIGILASLGVCTVLYILMSLTMTGLTPYQTLNVDAPVTVAIAAAPELNWLRIWVEVGAVAGLSTVILVSLYGQTRIFYAMARDGFLPEMFATVHPVFQTPAASTVLIGVLVAVLAGVFPLDFLGEIVSVGTLIAFVLVCVGVIVLRIQRPNVLRPFKAPLSPITPLLGIAVCGAMIYPLWEDTWFRVVGWFAVGLVIYLTYGVRHAKAPTWTLDDAPTK